MEVLKQPSGFVVREPGLSCHYFLLLNICAAQRIAVFCFVFKDISAFNSTRSLNNLSLQEDGYQLRVYSPQSSMF